MNEKRKPARRTKAKASDPAAPTPLEMLGSGSETSDGKVFARIAIDPLARHAQLAASFGIRALFGDRKPDLPDCVEVLCDEAAKAANGDMRGASLMLAAQAFSLDAMFTEMARRSGANMGEFPDAMERYMRLALKAQANCRATLEALAKLHQPREQTVKHVHVNEGGQAVVADQFHHHAGGKENAKIDKQSVAAGVAGPSAALPGPDPFGDGVPIPGGEREAAMQDARRDESGRT